MIVVEIPKGTRPEKPEDAARVGFTDGLWDVVEQRWSTDRDTRLTLDAVLSSLGEAAPGWRVAAGW